LTLPLKSAILSHMLPMIAAVLLSTGTVTLEGSLVWGYTDVHRQVLEYRQSVGQVPEYVQVDECVSVVGGCGWIGDQADLFLPGGRFAARLWVCDCAAAHDLEWNRERGRVAEVPWVLANQWWNPAIGPLPGVRIRHYSTERPFHPQ